MDSESEVLHHEDIHEKLDRIEAQLQQTQKSVVRIRKFMFWRLVVILVAILVPTIAIPIFLKIFLQGQLLPEYIEKIQLLVQ